MTALPLVGLISKSWDAALIVGGLLLLMGASFRFIWLDARKRRMRARRSAVALANALGFKVGGPGRSWHTSAQGTIDGIDVTLRFTWRYGVSFAAGSPRIPADFEVSKVQWKKLFRAEGAADPAVGPLGKLDRETVKELERMYSRTYLTLRGGKLTHRGYLYPDPVEKVRRFARVAKAIERALGVSG